MTLSFTSLLQAGRRSLLGLACCLLLVAVLLDWAAGLEVSLGFLYVLPILPAAIVLNRWQIVGLALACAVLRSVFVLATSDIDFVFRFLLAVLAYSGTGLFISEVVRNRRLVVEHMREVEAQQSLRREAEEYLRVLAESSPAAIFTLDDQARVLSANRAARQLFGYTDGVELTGERISSHLPVLSDALKLETASSFRTAAQCQGRRRDGSLFLAQTWFSTYETPHGRRLAAIAVDLSDETREREEQNLRQLLDNNRIIAGAVSHEIRNVCSAISLVYANLRRMEGLPASEDFHALGSLVEALENIAATELQAKAHPSLSPIDLHEVLNHLRIVIEPNWEEIDGQVQWDISPSLPAVMAEAFGLTQAFLNLAQNSHRAVQSSPARRLRIRAAAVDGHVQICFEDSGPGVREPDRLFQPFQRGAAHAGLGLYVSRAILRSYGGDLRYEPRGPGCCFVVDLPAAVRKGATAA